MSYHNIPQAPDRRLPAGFHPGIMPPFHPVAVVPSASQVPGSSFGLSGLGWNPAHVIAAAIMQKKQQEEAARKAKEAAARKAREEKAATKKAAEKEAARKAAEDKAAAIEPTPTPTTAHPPTLAPTPTTAHPPTLAPTPPDTTTDPTREEWRKLMARGSGPSINPSPPQSTSVTSVTTSAPRGPVTSATAPTTPTPVTQESKQGLIIGGLAAAGVVAYMMFGN